MTYELQQSRKPEITRAPIYFSDETVKTADSVLDSLLVSNYITPSQWIGLNRRRLQSRELYLLWAVFVSAWIDLVSPKFRVRRDASVFFTDPDAGKPVSLRFLIDVFDLDLRAVQAAARERIATGVRARGRRGGGPSHPSLIHMAVG